MLFFGIIFIAELVMLVRALWFLVMVARNIYLREQHKAAIQAMRAELVALGENPDEGLPVPGDERPYIVGDSTNWLTRQTV